MKSNRLVIISLLTVLVALLLGMGTRHGEQKIQHISLIKLLATPEKYDRTLVMVQGYYHQEFESSGLYLNKEHAKYRIYQNSIWIGSNDPTADSNDIQRTNDTYIRVVGVFYNAPLGGGHMGLWPGELHKIKLFKVWPED